MGIRTNLTAGITYPVNAIETLISGSSVVSISLWLSESSFAGSPFPDARTFLCLFAGSFYTPGIQICAAGGFLTVYARSQSGDSTQTLTSSITVDGFIGALRHVAVIVDFAGDSISLYVDGEMVAYATATFGASVFTPSGVSRNGRIGGTSASTGLSDATIAEIGIWTRALNDSEIRDLASGLSPGVVWSNLVAWMPLTGDAVDDNNLVSGTIATRAGAVVNGEHPFIHYGDDEEYLYWSASGSSGAIGHYYRYLLNRRRVHA